MTIGFGSIVSCSTFDKNLKNENVMFFLLISDYILSNLKNVAYIYHKESLKQ